MVHNRIFMALTTLLIVLSLAGKLTALHFPLTDVDARLRNYIDQEQRAWNEFPLPNASVRDSMNTVYYINVFSLGFYEAQLDLVLEYSEELAQNITEMNSTGNRVIDLLQKRRDSELKDLADNIVRTMPQKLTRIFAEVKRQSFKSFLSEYSDPCQTQSRPDAQYSHLEGRIQNVAVNVYKSILECLAKGYMISQMAYMTLVANGETKYKKEASVLRGTFTTEQLQFERDTRQIVEEKKYIIWNCDDYKLNNSHTQLINVWQGYIDNEANISPDGSCQNKCDDYHFTKQYRCEEDTICSFNYLDRNKTKCHGDIRDCTFIESNMQICSNENDEEPGKRYNYIKYGSGKVLGAPIYCPDAIEYKSWNRWFVECSYCFCFCDTIGPNTDRYFSLREQLANISDNRVVTGIQLVKHQQIIHLVISERQLKQNGGLFPAERSSTTWISNYNFKVNDTDVSEGYDYHTITPRNSAIDLDVLKVPSGHVLTGVRFRVVRDHLRFEIRATPFNYETGQLEKNKARSVWIGNNEQSKKRIFEPNTDVPTRSPKLSMRYRNPDYYIEFGYTSIEKDIAQTTVPFIETLPVEAHIPTILSGAGIYYKSQPGYGGFIAPLIITLNEEADLNRSTY